MSVKSLLRLNRRFAPVSHPFNEEAAGGKTYGEWEFERGGAALSCYAPKFQPEDILFGKDVLDVGCGEGGKSLYFLSLGAKSVTGIDIVPEYEEKSCALAEKLGLSDGFEYVCGDATNLPLGNGCFDVVMMNDFFEHVANPGKAISEAMRVLRPHGRLYINFPPYYHPYGAHLSDAISIPWVHMLYGEKTLISAYEALTADKPDRDRRLSLKIKSGPDGEKHLGYINKMTLRKASEIISESGLKPVYKHFIPLRKWLYPASRLPLVREMLVKMAVYVFEKEATVPSETENNTPSRNAALCNSGDIHSRNVSRLDV